MRKLSISKAWEETKDIVARDGRLLGSVALALIVLPQTLFGSFLPSAVSRISLTAQLAAIVLILIGLAAQVALNRLSIGPSTTVGLAIGRGFQRLPTLFVGFMIVIAAMTLLFVPIVIILGALGLIADPGAGGSPSRALLLVVLVYFAFVFAIFQLMLPTAAAEDVGPIRLVTRSWQLARANYWRLFAFLIAVIIGLVVVMLAGQLIAGIFSSALLGPAQPGTISAVVISFVLALIQASFTVVSAVMLARIYIQLAGPNQVSVPSSGT